MEELDGQFEYKYIVYSNILLPSATLLAHYNGEPCIVRIGRAEETDNEGIILSKLDHPQIPKMFICGPAGKHGIDALLGQIGRDLREDQKKVVNKLRRHRDLSYSCREVISGRTLEEEYPENSFPEDMEHLVTILHNTCIPLLYVHRKGYVHRDIKPENLVVDGNFVSLLDFDIAVKSGDENKPGGTRGYMAPEVTVADHADMRSDIFSFGKMAFRLIEGYVPEDDYYPPFKWENPCASKELHALAEGCSAPEPRERIQTIAHVQRKLRKIHSSHLKKSD